MGFMSQNPTPFGDDYSSGVNPSEANSLGCELWRLLWYLRITSACRALMEYPLGFVLRIPSMVLMALHPWVFCGCCFFQSSHSYSAFSNSSCPLPSCHGEAVCVSCYPCPAHVRRGGVVFQFLRSHSFLKKSLFLKKVTAGLPPPRFPSSLHLLTFNYVSIIVSCAKEYAKQIFPM